MNDKLERRMTERAVELGAAGARVIDADLLPVEDSIAELCRPPQCPAYGLSANCPPHFMGPDEFRELLRGYERALVFRLEAPMELLLSEERDHVTGLLQQMAASLERFAVSEGLPRARAFAGGCCKVLFCREHEVCSVLAGGACRNPDSARPSLSGLGVNFNRLNRSLGWEASRTPDDGSEPLGMMAGMVLLY
ncbi:MAG: DUF2284 domain-containing protein [Gemmatimonadetes bacterium]|nr:DUF2284 domain-containing protein [Gemmatimonadota bacterium]